MSETIEATTISAVPATTTTATEARPPLAARDLVRLTQGLYFVFWGLLVTVLVGAQTLLLFWLRTFSEVFLAVGILTTAVGTWRLYRTRLDYLPVSPVRQAWRSRSRALIVTAGLLVYFCALFYLWRRVPANLYLQVNAALFLATGVAFMTLLNRAVTALAGLVGREEMALESRVFAVINIGLTALPFVAALTYVVWMAVTHQTNPLDEFRFLLQRVSLLVPIVLLLPLSLTLSLGWAAKDVLVRQLTTLPARPAGESASRS